MENLQSKTPYKFKKSYGGTPEPQTPQDAPWLRGPSLKNLVLIAMSSQKNRNTHDRKSMAIAKFTEVYIAI